MGFLRHIAVFGAGALAGRRAASRRPRSTPPVVRKPARGWKWWAMRALVILPLLALAGFLVAASGIIPIKASSGHWAITRWFLEFSMGRSVATHSMGIRVPALDDPALVLKGAGHFETGCMPCHGSPDLPYPRVAWAMTPRPPSLQETAPEWEPEELFYIVKHGVKFTGMPAWPALDRDDEVWAMVAFLQRLPALSAGEYRRLIQGASAAVPPPRERDGTDSVDVPPLMALVQPQPVPPSVTTSCGRCHGVDGQGRENAAFPRLAGQRPNYLYASLQAYATGRRHSGIMQPIAAAMDLGEMQAVSRYYASLPAATPAPADTTDPASIARGAAIAGDGIPREDVPSCRDCHGPVPTRRNPYYPRLAGQFADYIVLQLQLFQQDKRGGSRYAHLMHPTAERLTEAQVRDVAAYYGSISE